VKRPRVPLGTGRAARLACLSVFLLLPGVSARAEGVDAIAERAGHSVVTVLAQRTVLRTERRSGKEVSRTLTRVGSGVAVEENAVVTTASVVRGAERILVRTSNGLQVEARLAGMDLVFNVALLRVPGLRLPWLGVSETPARLGDQVIVLGTSYGAQPTRSVGTIEYVYREPRTSLLQLTNIVFPGNSGAAALNAQGQLIGIVQGEMGYPDGGGARSGGARRPSGMSFVMPIGQLRPVYESLKRTGRMPHGYLGVSTSAEVVHSEVDNAAVGLGARVEGVRAKGPAARAGLRRGDLIVAFESERVEYPEQLARWVSETRPGTAVRLVWVRGEVQRQGTASLGEAADSLPAWESPRARAAASPVAGDAAAAADSARR
jgi:serine protease Do